MLNIFHKAPFNGHKGTISGVAFAPSGLEATTSAYSHQFLNRDAIVWNIPNGEIARTLRGHQVGVFSVACSPDGSRTATGGGGVVKWNSWVYDNAIRLWNREGLPWGKFGDDLYFVKALAFSPDGRSLLSGSNNSAPKADTKDGSSLRLWDMETFTEIRRFGRHTSAVHSVAFSPDGKQVAAGSSGMNTTGLSPGGTSMTMQVYSEPRAIPPEQETMTKVELLMRLDTEPFRQFADSFRAAADRMMPRQRIFVSFTTRPETSNREDRTLRMWDVNSGEEQSLFDHTGWINAIAYSPGGEHLYSAGRGVHCWDTRSGKETNRIEGECVDFVHSASLSPDGHYLAIGTGGQMENGAPYENCFTRLYSTETFSEVIAWPHKFPVTAMAFSPDGRYVLAGGEHSELHLWLLPANS